MEAKSSTLNRLCVPSVGNEEREMLVQCPSCNEKLSPYDVARHCDEEMERLRQMQLKVVADLDTQQPRDCTSAEEERRKPWTVFKRVQRNRQSRLKRTRKHSTPPPAKDHPCPVCNERYTQQEIQRHAEECLRRANGATNDGDENSSNEDEDGDEYEEYEWAGQKRIRVSSLIQGGYAAIGVGQTIINNSNQQDDDEEDLNVDEDDSQIYGPPQYGESDIIMQQNSTNNDSDVTSYMRRLITGDTNASVALSNAHHNETIETCDTIENNIPQRGSPEATTTATTTTTTTTITPPHGPAAKEQQEQIIEALKAKLRHYENHVQSKFKCLICLDDYRNPAISVSCWHVHCEECWLRSLGARKLCPQCNLITTPKDLRRIYM